MTTTAQTALDTATQFLQAGVLGLALAALIVALSAMGVAIFVIRYTGGRAKGDNELTSKLISSFNTELAGLIVETKTAIVKQTESNEKRGEIAARQTASMDHQTEVIEQLGFNFKSYQSMTADGLEGLTTNILNVVTRFAALDENIRTIEGAVKNNPSDHQAVLDALKNLSAAQDKIFNLIDSRLPERAKTDTPAPMRLHPATDVFRKRETDSVPKVEPGTKPDEPPLKPTG